jgi:hypothetical protein
MTILTVPNLGSFPTFNLSSLLTQPTDESPAEDSPVGLAPVDELQLSSGDEDPSFELVRADTRLHTRTQLRIDEDGSIRFKSRTNLRYKYEFEAADGTRIQIKVRANLSYAAKLDEDGDLKIRVRAKLQVSLLQESVNSNAASLLSLGENDELFSALTEALAAFNDVVTHVTSDILNGESLDGDRLITGLVSAFNELADAIDFTQPNALPQTDLPTSIEPLADEATLAESSTSPEPLVIPDAPPPIDVLQQETLTAIKLVENSPLAEVSAINEPAALAETVDFQSLRLQLRYRFTESLYQLLDLFDGSDDQPSTLTRLSYRLSAKLSLSARFDAASGGEPEVPAFDASA